MEIFDKKNLSERDICTKFITPALIQSGWDLHSQIREQVKAEKTREALKRELMASRGGKK